MPSAADPVRQARPVVARARVHPSIHPDREEGLLPGPSSYDPKLQAPEVKGPKWNDNFLVTQSRYHRTRNPWGVQDVWRHVVIGLDSPGPAYIPLAAAQVPPKQGFSFAMRQDIIDNMMQSGLRTAAQTPGPGAHTPELVDVSHAATMHGKLRSRVPLLPGPACYATDSGSRLTLRNQPRCTFSRASRGDVFRLPRPGEASPGPQSMSLTDALLGLSGSNSPLKRQLHAVHLSGSAGGSFSRARRWRREMPGSPGPLYKPSLDAARAGTGRVWSIGPSKPRRKKGSRRQADGAAESTTAASVE
eukprot:TRINITY_DN3221_c0_g1_i1.p1 TRINITY_DN3221_c0_g1~~TRINITY_DN3221_c0_g1_i1.p1  ORF type:complete len:303 (+),score=58.55 TRINITY_DN3221_c0_g1_i1:69-977(+)